MGTASSALIPTWEYSSAECGSSPVRLVTTNLGFSPLGVTWALPIIRRGRLQLPPGAPTRAEFLTDRYFPKTGVSGVSQGERRLNPDETTIADIFKSAGYATGAFGKWHNGTQSPYHPNDRGFDEFYGFTSGHWGAYFSPSLDHECFPRKGLLRGFAIVPKARHII